MIETAEPEAQSAAATEAVDATIARSLRLLAFALIFGLAAVLLLRQQWAKEHQWTWLFLLAVMFAGAAGLRGLELWLPGQPILPRLTAFAGRRDRLIGLGPILLGLFISAWFVWRLLPDYHQWQGTVIYWVLSMLLVMVGAWFIRAVGRGAPRAATALTLWPDTRRNRWLEAAAVLLILALAIFVRTYRFNSIPPGIYVDETNGGLDALYINEGRAVSPFGTGWYGTPNAYLYYMAEMFKLFGANWFSLKLVSLIPAILTIPAVYLLGRLMFGPLAGLCAMLLMAVSRWHLSMSRWGWNETAPPLFQVLSFFFLIRGLRDRRALDYALSGLLMGISIYTYLSARLALATLGLYVLYWIFSDPSGWWTSLRRSWLGFVLLGMAFAVTVAPIAVTYITDPFSFQNRVSEISVFRDVKDQRSLAPLAANITDVLKFFHQTGDHQGKHNLPDEPMTDPITGLLFAIGLGYAFLGWRDQRKILLLMWLVLGLAGSFLSSQHESPQSYRALTALPAVVLLAADVLDRVARAVYCLMRDGQLAAARPSVAPLAAGLLVLVALGGSALWETDVYFGKQASSMAVIRGFNPTENSVAHETIAALKQGEAIYLAPQFSSYAPLRFLVYGVVKARTGESTLDRPPWHVVLPEVNLPLPDTGNDVLMMLDSTYWPLRDFISSLYPDAEMKLVVLADGSPIYMRVKLPEDQVAALQGLTERTTFADGRQSERIVSQVSLSASEAPDADVEWDGAIRLEHGGEYEFEPEGGLQVFIDGKPFEGRRYLGRGMYSLHLVRLRESTGDARLIWQVGDSELAEVLAEALFRKSGREQGLLSTYWNNMNWEGEPMFSQVTPFLMLAWPDEQPIVPNGEFSARYTGQLHITEPGTYQFHIEADDGARLTLDGQVLGEGLTPGQPNNFDATIDLGAGDHPIQIDYFQQGGGSGLRFFWSVNGGPQTPVPPSALIPAQP
jgi:4-amino-4-deoxy-L-arabinose transferase-like glycosyltransferase